jgi:HEAT repeats/SMI1 / KNR4 family (SUKH-1)
MSRINWRPFLVRWSSELMASELAGRVSPAPESPDWLGFAPAEEQELKDLEDRLGMALPPSYRSFLFVTNGWRRTTFAVDRIRPAAEVDWFRVENEQWVDLYPESGSDLPDDEYYNYTDGSAPDHRADHMKSLVQISDVDDGVYLINPEAVTPDGEWEAWFFANWVPGAVRYPSFAHLMVQEYLSFARVEHVKLSKRGLPRLVVPGPEVPRSPAKRARKEIAKGPTIDELIVQMGELGGKPLDRALRTFQGRMKGRPSARRRPEIVPVLVDLYHSSSHAGVRSACVTAITEFAVDPPPLLLESLSDPDPWVILSGIFSLTYFPNSAALEPLCRFVESRANVLINENAMSALGKIGDERAVPTLVGVLLDTDTHFDQSFGTAAIALSRCGHKGFEALVSALNHADPRVRRAAVVGVDCSGNPEAGALLDRMEADPDPQVRQRAKHRMGNFYFK